MRDRLVRLPKSLSRRSSRVTYCALLSDIDPNATSGFGWKGKYLKSGSLIKECDLWPSDEYPLTPLLLECADNPDNLRGHKANQADSLWILWTYRDGEWHELGRSLCRSWQWVWDLKPIGLRAMAEARGGVVVKVEPDLDAISARITLLLDQELAAVGPTDRSKVLCVIHDQLASRVASLLA
jgi:hypothetical protein